MGQALQVANERAVPGSTSGSPTYVHLYASEVMAFTNIYPACFNREFMTEMSDIASASILQLESLAEGHELPTTHFKNEMALLRGALSYAATNLPGGVLLPEEDPVDGLEFASERPLDFDAEQYSETKQNNVIAELEGQLANAVH